MLERGIGILWRYLRAMDPFWVAASFAAGLVCYAARKKKSCMHAGVTAFLVVYLCLVYTSTVLSRDTKAEIAYRLTPLWTYARLMQGQTIFLQYIVLNILMLVPVGVCLSFLWKSKRKIVCFGLGFSVLIELSQLVTARGLCEVDDVIHNTAGVFLGTLLYTAMERIKDEYFGNRCQGHGRDRLGEQSEEHSGREKQNPSQSEN